MILCQQKPTLQTLLLPLCLGICRDCKVPRASEMARNAAERCPTDISEAGRALQVQLNERKYAETLYI